MTRLIPATSLVMRDEIFRSTSDGKTNLRCTPSELNASWSKTKYPHQSAVMKSSDCTARSAMT